MTIERVTHPADPLWVKALKWTRAGLCVPLVLLMVIMALAGRFVTFALEGGCGLAGPMGFPSRWWRVPLWPILVLLAPHIVTLVWKTTVAANSGQPITAIAHFGEALLWCWLLSRSATAGLRVRTAWRFRRLRRAPFAGY